MKTKLISEYKDATATFNRLISTCAKLGDTSMSVLESNLIVNYNSLTESVASINDKLTEASPTGLSNILNTFSAFYNSAEALNEAITNSLTDISVSAQTQLTQLSDSYNITASRIAGVESDVKNLTTNFKFDADGLTIKSTANATKYIKLDNDSLDFMDNGHMVAQISDNSLNISNAKIEDQMQIGNISIKPSGNGGLMFVYE
jgi:hypothetical protein